jgi:hypothetical protein
MRFIRKVLVQQVLNLVHKYFNLKVGVGMSYLYNNGYQKSSTQYSDEEVQIL